MDTSLVLAKDSCLDQSLDGGLLDPRLGILDRPQAVIGEDVVAVEGMIAIRDTAGRGHGFRGRQRRYVLVTRTKD